LPIAPGAPGSPLANGSGMRFSWLVVLAACTSSAPSQPLAPFPTPTGTLTATTYDWIYYDSTDDHGTMFENFAPVAYQELSARAGAKLTIQLTAMKSSTEWVPDPSKQIDGVVLEGVPASDGSLAWTQLARAASVDGVLTMTATATGDTYVHLVGVEADPASYDDSASPAVEFIDHLVCDAGTHDHCAVAAQPGEACTISPLTCDGPFQGCIAPDGECGNTGTCQRSDVLCDGQGPAVCTCDGQTLTNRCYATGLHKSVRHEGACP
jgi:hypothetical protein